MCLFTAQCKQAVTSWWRKRVDWWRSHVYYRSADEVETRRDEQRSSWQQRTAYGWTEHPPAEPGPLGPSRPFGSAWNERKLHTKLTRFLKVLLCEKTFEWESVVNHETAGLLHRYDSSSVQLATPSEYVGILLHLIVSSYQSYQSAHYHKASTAL